MKIISGPSILLLLCCSAIVLGATSYQQQEAEVGEDIQAQPNVLHAIGPLVPPSDSHNTSKRGVLQVLTPQQIASAYSFTITSSGGTGKIIAIIEPFGTSTAEADLLKFTSQWGLPTCSTSNGCFKKVDQSGGNSIPADDKTGNWGLIASTSLQAAHGMAPAARKYLVCAKSASLTDLMVAVLYAANTLKAHYIIMTWGTPESSSILSSYDSYFNYPSSSYFALTGDNGYSGGILYPASSSKVIAVGGTSLYTTSGSFSSEQGWPGSGGGCSAVTPAISAQSSHSGYSALGCVGRKALPDASLNADPNSGMYVYYSGLINNANPCSSPNCWWSSGGTTLATSLLASRAAARGIMTTPASLYNNGYIYRDITVGSNGKSCTTGQDLVTGIGSLLG